jgi:hypothetical protein
MDRACNVHWGDEKLVQSFSGMPEKQKPLRRPRRRWKDNIKIDLREAELVYIRIIWLRVGTDIEFL